MFYIALFNIAIICSIVVNNKSKIREQIYYIILIGIFIFSAFRFEVGCDWSGYLNQFFVSESMSTAEAWTQAEGLWFTIFFMQHWLKLPYPWINVFSSLIFFAGLHAMAKKQPDPLYFLIFLFPILIINLPMSGIRQASALGILFFALNAFNDRKPIYFVFFTILAAGFHSSALIFLLLTPFVRGGGNIANIFFALFLAVPGLLFLMRAEFTEVAIERYVGTGVDANGAVFRIGLLILGAAYFLIIAKKRWKYHHPQDYTLALTGSLGIVAIAVILPLSSVIADRMAYYLIPIQAMIFARISYLYSRGRGALSTHFPFAILSVAFFVWVLYSEHFSQCYTPYKTWLFGFPD